MTCGAVRAAGPYMVSEGKMKTHNEGTAARKQLIERANHFLRQARKEQNVGYAYSARETYEAFGWKEGIEQANKVIEDLLNLTSAPRQVAA